MDVVSGRSRVVSEQLWEVYWAYIRGMSLSLIHGQGDYHCVFNWVIKAILELVQSAFIREWGAPDQINNIFVFYLLHVVHCIFCILYSKLYYIVSGYITLYDTTSNDILFYNTILHYTILYYIVLCDIILCHVKLNYNRLLKGPCLLYQTSPLEESIHF